jgi:hypothetical protein
MSALFAAVFAAVVAAPAAAQTQDETGAANTVVASNDTTNLSFNLPSGLTFDTSDQAKPQTPTKSASPTHQMGGKQVSLTVQGGFDTCCGFKGFILGVGASFLPMKDNQNISVLVDGNYSHINNGGGNGVYISANGVYNVTLQNSKAKPFFGAGLSIFHIFSQTDTNFQILGGVGWNLASGRSVNGQVRFIFDTDTITMFLFGFAF